MANAAAIQEHTPARTINPLAAILALFCSAFPALSQEKITYQDQILPLIEANCSKCHNADKKKADLELTSYQGALKGSGSGVVLVAGDPPASKLWKAPNHPAKPFMPPHPPTLSDQHLVGFKK